MKKRMLTPSCVASIQKDIMFTKMVHCDHKGMMDMASNNFRVCCGVFKPFHIGNKGPKVQTRNLWCAFVLSTQKLIMCA